MGGSFFQLAVVALGAGILGAVGGWLVQAVKSKRRIDQVTGAAVEKLNAVIVQRDQFANDCSRSQAKNESLQARIEKQNSELQSVVKQSKLLVQNVRTLRTEREDTKRKLSTLQNALGSLRQQTTSLQNEFRKSQAFYKRELTKSIEKRKLLEIELKEARSEQENFARLVESSTLEHGSSENMIVAAQLRLGQIQVLERNVNKLEAENTQLRRDHLRIKQEFEERERDLAELEELRIHNRQLVRCVEGLEGSRKESENDADRYREKADQSERLSDTLRLRLRDLEENFAEIEKQQGKAINDARQAAVVPLLRNQR